MRRVNLWLKTLLLLSLGCPIPYATAEDANPVAPPIISQNVSDALSGAARRPASNGVEMAPPDAKGRIPVLIKLREAGEDPQARRSSVAKERSKRIEKEKVKSLHQALGKAFEYQNAEEDFGKGFQLDNVPWMSASINKRALDILREHPNVAMVVEDGVAKASLAQSVPLIHADDVHSISVGGGYDGSGVVVAVIDSGVDSDHPSLKGSIVAQECFRFERDCPNGTTRDSWQGNPEDNNGHGSAEDNNGHGSHVTGIITSDGSNGVTYGVSPAADIVAIKVLGSDNGGKDSNVISAIDWVVNHRLDHDGIDIINLSLSSGFDLSSGKCDFETGHAAYGAVIDAAVDAGIVVFASSGNNGAYDKMSGPACLSSVISVGMTWDADGSAKWVTSDTPSGFCEDVNRHADNIACNSNRSEMLDLLAPGNPITSTWLNGGTNTIGGTSQASPHAAGVAALLLSKNPSLSPAQIRHLLRTTDVSIEDDKIQDAMGANMKFPRVDALAAIRAVNAALLPGLASFGSQYVGTVSAEKTFAVRNLSNEGPTPAAIQLTSFAIDGLDYGDFKINGHNCPSSLPAGSACTIRVSFAPKSVGEKQAELRVRLSGTAPMNEFSAHLAGSTPINLPVTGQTTSLAAGDDGAIKAGVSWPNPRFSGYDVVTDHLTGLQWLGDGSCLGEQPWYYPGKTDSVEVISNLNTGITPSPCYDYSGTYHDWRLPTVTELYSLFNGEEGNQAGWLNSQGFSVNPSRYWTSTIMDETHAWYVDLSTGALGTAAWTSPQSILAVRTVDNVPSIFIPAPVRQSGQTKSFVIGDDGSLMPGVPWPSPRFRDNGDGTVTDNLTGLLWLKNAECLGSTTWSGALGKAASFNITPDAACGGYTAEIVDWRLPNRNELLSVVDYGESGPMVDAGYPFLNLRSTPYWTSTSNAGDTAQAWWVNLYSGDSGSWSKSQNGRVWLVSSAVPSSFTVIPSSFDFGGVAIGQTSNANIFSVVNDGDVPLAITKAELAGANAGEFALAANTCQGVYLYHGQSCTVEVTFKPTSEGGKSASLNFNSNNPALPQQVASLSGRGTQPTPLSPSATIHSKAAGGNWSNPATWYENRVPVASDIVEINAVVYLDVNAEIAGLSVLATGTLEGYGTLLVQGDIFNRGTIRDGNALTIRAGKSLYNDGLWNNNYVELVGMATRRIGGANLIAAGGIGFMAAMTLDNSVVLAPTGQVNFNGYLVALSSANTLVVQSDATGVNALAGKKFVFKGNVSATPESSYTLNLSGGTLEFGGNNQSLGVNTINANEVLFSGGGIKSVSTLSITSPRTSIANGVTLTGGSLAVHGGLVNNGRVIYDPNYGAMDVSLHGGDIENNGIWTNGNTFFYGGESRKILGIERMNSSVLWFMDSFTIANPEPVVLSPKDNVDFGGKTISVNQGYSLIVKSNASGVATLNAARVAFYGDVQASPDSGYAMTVPAGVIEFAGGDQMLASLSSQEISAGEVHFLTGGDKIIGGVIRASRTSIAKGVAVMGYALDVYGALVNEGTIGNYSGTFSNMDVHLFGGDIENNGAWVGNAAYFHGGENRKIAGIERINSSTLNFMDGFVITNEGPVVLNPKATVYFNGYTIGVNSGNSLIVESDAYSVATLDAAEVVFKKFVHADQGVLYGYVITVPAGSVEFAGDGQSVFCDELNATKVAFSGPGSIYFSAAHSSTSVAVNTPSTHVKNGVSLTAGLMILNGNMEIAESARITGDGMTIYGTFLNNGVIGEDDYHRSFGSISLYGDHIENKGEWFNQSTYFYGAGSKTILGIERIRSYNINFVDPITFENVEPVVLAPEYMVEFNGNPIGLKPGNSLIIDGNASGVTRINADKVSFKGWMTAGGDGTLDVPNGVVEFNGNDQWVNASSIICGDLRLENSGVKWFSPARIYSPLTTIEKGVVVELSTSSPWLEFNGDIVNYGVFRNGTVGLVGANAESYGAWVSNTYVQWEVTNGAEAYAFSITGKAAQYVSYNSSSVDAFLDVTHQGGTFVWQATPVVWDYDLKDFVPIGPSTAQKAIIVHYGHSGATAPKSYSFPQTSAGQTSVPQSLRFLNAGGIDLELGTVGLSGTDAGDFVKDNDTCSGATLVPGSECTVNVSFAPKSAGVKHAALEVTTDSSETPVLSIALTNQGQPSASSLSVTGLLKEGQVLDGRYVYSDPDGAVERNSVYQWYRAFNAQGGTASLLAEGTDKSFMRYTLSSADLQKYVRFCVIPANFAAYGGQSCSGWVGPVGSNAAPSVQSVVVSGDGKVGGILHGDYAYSDPEGDPEGSSVFKWYRANDALGSGKVLISQGAALTYFVTSADSGKFIGLGVTPKAVTGTASGTEVFSAFVGPISSTNYKPRASNVSITGKAEVNGVLQGIYVYEDSEGDAEQGSQYRWYRADNASGANAVTITGATTKSYTVKAEDVGRYIGFSVTPAASAGVSPGDIAYSGYVGPVTAEACQSNVSLTGNYSSGESKVMSKDTIATNGSTVVYSGATLNLAAVSKITLRPGFHAQAGSKVVMKAGASVQCGN